MLPCKETASSTGPAVVYEGQKLGMAANKKEKKKKKGGLKVD